MKLIRHERRPTINSIKLKSNPLTVWLGTRTELKIKRGDNLEDVARLITKENPWNVHIKVARQIAAYWFALGERVVDGRVGTKWRTKELDANPTRIYRG